MKSRYHRQPTGIRYLLGELEYTFTHWMEELLFALCLVILIGVVLYHLGMAAGMELNAQLEPLHRALGGVR